MLVLSLRTYDSHSRLSHKPLLLSCFSPIFADFRNVFLAIFDLKGNFDWSFRRLQRFNLI